MTMSAKAFLFVFLHTIMLELSLADSKCNAICYVDSKRLLSCKLLSDITGDDASYSSPVSCQRKQYPRSTEIIIGTFEEIEGIQPGGLDILSTSESSSSYKLQLTLKLKIKLVGAGLFGKLNNLQRLQIHPENVNPCAFFDLPKSLKQVLMQCVSSKMRMLDDMFWPTNSNVEFKINMCLQKVTCYSCKSSGKTPLSYSLLKSKYQGPLALNRRVSLTSCEVGYCHPDPTVCLPAVTTTTTPTTTTATTTTTKTTTASPTTPTTKTTKIASTVRQEPEEKRSYISKLTASSDSRAPGQPESTSNTSGKTDLLVLVLLGATGINTIILLVLVCLIIHVSGCCRRKKQRGVFLMSKGNYPPEYSTLRPV